MKLGWACSRHGKWPSALYVREILFADYGLRSGPNRGKKRRDRAWSDVVVTRNEPLEEKHDPPSVNREMMEPRQKNVPVRSRAKQVKPDGSLAFFDPDARPHDRSDLRIERAARNVSHIAPACLKGREGMSGLKWLSVVLAKSQPKRFLAVHDFTRRCREALTIQSPLDMNHTADVPEARLGQQALKPPNLTLRLREGMGRRHVWKQVRKGHLAKQTREGQDTCQ